MRLSASLTVRAAFLVAGIALAAPQRAAAQISLSLIATYARNSPFGIAFDGTNIWYSDGGSTAYAMTTAGVNTGATTPMFNGWSALAWDGSRDQLVSKGRGGGVVSWYDRLTGGNRVDVTPPDGAFELIDGLDVANGQLWYSPDVSDVFIFDIATTGGVPSGLSFAPGGNTFLSGTYSGVVRANVAGASYILTVNDASSPRRLCVNRLDASLIGCQDFVNQRYEDLAFDGRYLWAADFYGNKIDKFDVIGGGGSIFTPTPEPATVALTAAGLAAVALGARRRRRTG